MTTTIQTVGNLGRDPELKYFESGSCVCKLPWLLNSQASNKRTAVGKISKRGGSRLSYGQTS